MRVLIIDDSSSMRMLLGRILDDLGVEHDQAQDGREALQVLEQEGPFELAMVDWQMPVMDGIEFVRAVRARYADDGPRLLMVTSVNLLESVVEALEAGADEYIMKPFTKEALLEKMAMLGFELS